AVAPSAAANRWAGVQAAAAVQRRRSRPAPTVIAAAAAIGANAHPPWVKNDCSAPANGNSSATNAKPAAPVTIAVAVGERTRAGAVAGRAGLRRTAKAMTVTSSAAARMAAAAPTG